MHAISVGAISGAILSLTSSYVVTGRLFHRFQRATPNTWRNESWRNHGTAIVLQAAAGAAIGGVFVAAGSPSVGDRLVEFGLGLWGTLAAFLLVQAVYVRWQWGFVLLDADAVLNCTSRSGRRSQGPDGIYVGGPFTAFP